MAPKRQEVTSQATPLSGDVLDILRGQIAEGSFGTGAGPLQQEAGTAMRQFVNSGGGSFDLSPMMTQLEDIQKRRVKESTADLREGYGVMGSRYGTPMAVGEGRMREGMESNFMAQISDLLLQDFTNQQNRLQSGIGQLFGMGEANIQPYLQMAAMGINPDVFTENPWVTGIKTAAGVAEGAATAAGMGGFG